MGTSTQHRQQNMKIFTAGIILLLTGSGWATPQFKFNLGGLFGGVTVPRNNNNQENTNANNPLQAAGSLFGGALEEILANTDVSNNNNNQENTNTNNPLRLLGGALEEILDSVACPPLLGDPAPPGCSDTFVDDGDIPCWNDTDCPSPGTCLDDVCNLYVAICPQPVKPPGCIPHDSLEAEALLQEFYEEYKESEGDILSSQPNSVHTCRLCSAKKSDSCFCLFITWNCMTVYGYNKA